MNKVSNLKNRSEERERRERKLSMAATMGSWAKKPGAWALDSEEHEDELLKQRQDEKENGSFAAAAGNVNPAPLADFPSLTAAAATKPSKKKKGQTYSLSEFTSGVSVGLGSARSQPIGLTPDEMQKLPTAPREKTAEELDANRLGGGFRVPHDNGRSRYSSRDGSPNSRWGSSRVSDESRRGGFGREPSRDSGSSRADEIDDWGAAKKSSMNNGFERRERAPLFESHSKADESDNWASNKSFVPSEGRRFGGGGGGFDRERRGGFDAFPREGAMNGNGADSGTWGRKREEGGGAGPTGGVRPVLNLQPRTLPLSNGEQKVSSVDVAAAVADAVVVAKPKGSNPFGAARPREEVLAEKGQDWKKMDEQLEAMRLKETTSALEGSAFARRSIRSGNGRPRSPEERTERAWRKPESVDSRPSSAGTSENLGAPEN